MLVNLYEIIRNLIHFAFFFSCVLYVIEIDECVGNHDCEDTCVNTNGSYVCQCGPGYQLAKNRRNCTGKVFDVKTI